MLSLPIPLGTGVRLVDYLTMMQYVVTVSPLAIETTTQSMSDLTGWLTFTRYTYVP